LDKIETVLTNCIKEIKSGNSTLADCLNRYPSIRRELEPLLKLALDIKEPPSIKMDSREKQAVKAKLLQQIKSSRQKKSRSFADVFSFGLFPRLGWARAATSGLVVATLLSTLAGGTAYAAQSSLPGDMLYPVKTSTEDARLLVAGDNLDEAELNLQFAQIRLEEISKLAGGNEEIPDASLSRYRRHLAATGQQISRTSDTAVVASRLESSLVKLQNQVAFTDDIIDANPAYTAQVNEASTLAANEQVVLLGMLAPHNIQRAAQIDLDAMQNRLQRARITANGNQYQVMQTALLQYQQFSQLGEQILQTAQASNNYSTEIENLISEALAGYLDILDSILKQAPQAYQNNIEACRQMTSQFQTQAHNRYQQQGKPTMGADGSPSGVNSGSGTGQEGRNAPGYQGGNGTPGTTAPAPGNGGNSGKNTNSGGVIGGSASPGPGAAGGTSTG
jgi:hypothetical protein